MKPWEMFQKQKAQPKPWEMFSKQPAPDEPKIQIDQPNNSGEQFNITQTPDQQQTAVTTVDMSQSDVISNPQYLTPEEGAMKDEAIVEQAQKQADIQGFVPGVELDKEGNSIVTLTDGSKVLVRPSGLVDTSMDIALMMPTGKLSIFDPLPKDIKAKLFTPIEAEGKLSKEARIFLRLNQGRISSEEAVRMLEGIPKRDQVMSLAESTDLARNYFSRAIGDDSRLAAKLGRRLEVRRNVFKPFIADEKEVAVAKQSYEAMRKKVDEVSTGTFDTTIIRNKLEDKILSAYETDPSGIGTALRKINLDTSEPITAGQALDLRENINGLLRKPAVKSSYKTTKALTEIRDAVDNFLNKTLDVDTANEVKRVVTQYRETMNRRRFGELLDKHTKADYAVDWDKLLADVKKEKLGGKNTEFVVPILKEFSKKFHNDKYLANAITPMGDSKNLSWLGALSYAIGKTYDILSPVINRSRYKDVLIRKAIIKSIKKADPKDPLKFVDDLVKGKHITIEQAEEIKKAATPMLEYKPDAKLTGDVNLKPKYGTVRGTVADNPTTAALHDAQVDLVRQRLQQTHGDEVLAEVDSVLTTQAEKQLKSLIDHTRSKENIDRVAKMAEREANKLAEAISKDVGVKLPKEEVAKLYKSKLVQLMGAGTAASAATAQDPEEEALQNILRFESDKLYHGDGQTYYMGIDEKNLDPRVMKAIGFTIEDLRKDPKTVGEAYARYKIRELNEKSPFSEHINAKIANLAILNDYLIKNIGDMKDIKDLEKYLLHGTPKHRYVKSPEAKRAHKTLILLKGGDNQSGIEAMTWLYDRYGKRIVADEKLMNAFEQGNKEELRKRLSKYLRRLKAADRVTLERKLF